MKNQTGFTIIELFIVILVAGVLVAIAVPSYTKMIRNNCITTSTNLLVSSLQYARSEAIKLRQTVSVLDNPDWNTGWKVSQGANDLRFVELTCGQGGAVALTVTETGGATQIDYLPTGFALNSATFNICYGNSGDPGRQINLLVTGRPQTNSNFTCP